MRCTRYIHGDVRFHMHDKGVVRKCCGQKSGRAGAPRNKNDERASYRFVQFGPNVMAQVRESSTVFNRPIHLESGKYGCLSSCNI